MIRHHDGVIHWHASPFVQPVLKLIERAVSTTVITHPMTEQAAADKYLLHRPLHDCRQTARRPQSTVPPRRLNQPVNDSRSRVAGSTS